MSEMNANEFLMAGGVSSAKFEAVGASVSGPITSPPEVQQQRDFTTGEPKFWDDGKPMQQIKIVLATAQRDPSDPQDEGERALYVKGKMLQAVRQAIRAAGARGMEVGGTLTVTYTGDGEIPRRGMNAPKLYSAVYAAPAPGAAANDVLMGAPAPQAPAAPAAAAPQPATPAPAAPAPGGSPEAAAAIAQLTPEQRAALGL